MPPPSTMASGSSTLITCAKERAKRSSYCARLCGQPYRPPLHLQQYGVHPNPVERDAAPSRGRRARFQYNLTCRNSRQHRVAHQRSMRYAPAPANGIRTGQHLTIHRDAGPRQYQLLPRTQQLNQWPLHPPLPITQNNWRHFGCKYCDLKAVLSRAKSADHSSKPN